MAGRVGRSGRIKDRKSARKRKDSGTPRPHYGQSKRNAKAAKAMNSPPIGGPPEDWPTSLARVWHEIINELPPVVAVEANRSRIYALVRAEIVLRSKGGKATAPLFAEVRRLRDDLERIAQQFVSSEPKPPIPRQLGWPKDWTPPSDAPPYPAHDKGCARWWEAAYGPGGFLDDSGAKRPANFQHLTPEERDEIFPRWRAYDEKHSQQR